MLLIEDFKCFQGLISLVDSRFTYLRYFFSSFVNAEIICSESIKNSYILHIIVQNLV